MKVSDVMTTNLVAAQEGTTAREIGTKLLTVIRCKMLYLPVHTKSIF